jgi:hypothetical protein
MQNRSFQSTWFENFPWLHYDEKSDWVLCFTCSKQCAEGNLKTALKKELTFMTEGFSNWKKATEKFSEHQISDCHKTSLDFEVNIPIIYGNVIEMTNVEMQKILQSNRHCLLKVIETLQLQGLAIQGDTDVA